MRGRRWWLLALLGVVVLGHSAALYFLRSHFTLSATVMAAVIALVLVMHLARRWSQRGR